MVRKDIGTKEKLIATATRLIWASSYNAVSVDDICKEADVKKGSFYHYFPSKAHLALESMMVAMEDFKKLYDDIFSPTRPPLERFQKMVRFAIDQQKEISETLGHACGCPFVTLGSELAAQDPEIGKTITDVCKQKTIYYESALRDLVRDGLIPEDTNIPLKANEIYAFMIGQLIMARINNDLEAFEQNMEHGLFDLIGIKQTNKKDKLTA